MSYKRISPVPIVEGGTGAQTLTSNGVLLGNGTSAITATAAGTTGQVLTGVTSGAPTFQSPAASSITITGDSGGGLTGASFTFTGGTTGLTFSGSGSTETVTGTLAVKNGGTGAATLTGVLTGNGTSAVTANAITQHGVLIGGASNAVSSLGVAATGATLMGSTGADPAFTGSPSFSGSVTAGTTITATSGNITATSGSLVITAAGNLSLPTTSSTAGNVTIGGTRFMHGYGSNNTFLGLNSGNYTLSGNSNIGIGADACNGLTSANNNSALGLFAGFGLTSGGNNTAIGYASLDGVTTGTGNIALGYNAGTGYVTGTESNNIAIGSAGTNAESNVLRIGSATGTGAGQLNAAYISGVTGIVVTGSAAIISSGNQLGVLASSKQFKNDIQDMGDTSAVLKLRPVTFIWNKQASPGLADATDERQYGLIAEETHDIMPSLVNYVDGKPFSVKYTDLPAILLNELQKALKRIEILENKCKCG